MRPKRKAARSPASQPGSKQTRLSGQSTPTTPNKRQGSSTRAARRKIPRTRAQVADAGIGSGGENDETYQSRKAGRPAKQGGGGGGGGGTVGGGGGTVGGWGGGLRGSSRSHQSPSCMRTNPTYRDEDWGEIKFEDWGEIKFEDSRKLPEIETQQFVRIKIPDTEDKSRMRNSAQSFYEKFEKKFITSERPCSLFIVITGDALPIDLAPPDEQRLFAGLSAAVTSSSAWLTTGGTEAGIMQVIGKMKAEMHVDAKLIGFSAWEHTYGKKAFPDPKREGSSDVSPVIYKNDILPTECDRKGPWLLDPRHTHYCLMDNDGEMESHRELFKEEFEAKLCGARRDANGRIKDVKIPSVCLVYGGGPGSVQTLHSAVVHNCIPAVIIPGSGRLADIILDGKEKLEKGVTDQELEVWIQEQLHENEMLRGTYKEVEQRNKLAQKVKEIITDGVVCSWDYKSDEELMDKLVQSVKDNEFLINDAKLTTMVRWGRAQEVKEILEKGTHELKNKEKRKEAAGELLAYAAYHNDGEFYQSFQNCDMTMLTCLIYNELFPGGPTDRNDREMSENYSSYAARHKLSLELPQGNAHHPERQKKLEKLWKKITVPQELWGSTKQSETNLRRAPSCEIAAFSPFPCWEELIKLKDFAQSKLQYSEMNVLVRTIMTNLRQAPSCEIAAFSPFHRKQNKTPAVTCWEELIKLKDFAQSKLQYSEMNVLVWAIMTDRKEIARKVCVNCRHPLLASLLASNVTRQLIAEFRGMEECDKDVGLEDEKGFYDKVATDVLDSLQSPDDAVALLKTDLKQLFPECRFVLDYFEAKLLPVERSAFNVQFLALQADNLPFLEHRYNLRTNQKIWSDGKDVEAQVHAWCFIVWIFVVFLHPVTDFRLWIDRQFESLTQILFPQWFAWQWFAWLYFIYLLHSSLLQFTLRYKCNFDWHHVLDVAILVCFLLIQLPIDWNVLDWNDTRTVAYTACFGFVGGIFRAYWKLVYVVFKSNPRAEQVGVLAQSVREISFQDIPIYCLLAFFIVLAVLPWAVQISNNNTSDSDNNDPSNDKHTNDVAVFFMLLKGIFGEPPDFENFDRNNNTNVLIFLFMFYVLTCVVMSNMLEAKMNNTYDAATAKANIRYRQHQTLVARQYAAWDFQTRNILCSLRWLWLLWLLLALLIFFCDEEIYSFYALHVVGYTSSALGREFGASKCNIAAAAPSKNMATLVLIIVCSIIYCLRMLPKDAGVANERGTNKSDTSLTPLLNKLVIAEQKARSVVADRRQKATAQCNELE